MAIVAAAAAAWAPLAPRAAARKSEAKSSLSPCSSCNLGLQGTGLRRRLGVQRWTGREELTRADVNVVRARVDDADDVNDEDVVKDMERYLNELSVEYENVWDTKPVWCQPWTIVLTGVTGISLSWLVIHSPVVTGIVSVLVAAWWYLFLYTYPMAYTAMIAERRKKQKNGVEDTYGLRTRND